MKYPEEAIVKLLERKQVLFPETITLCEYAQWAHEQLRPRNITAEIPPAGTPLLGMGPCDDHWVPCQYNEKHAWKLLGVTHWLPMPPSPEGPDPFEEWFQEMAKTREKFSWEQYKDVANMAWQAALKWREGQE